MSPSPRQRMARRDAGGQAVLAALLAIAATAATAGFHAVFDSWTFIAAAAVGAAVAALVSQVTCRTPSGLRPSSIPSRAR